MPHVSSIKPQPFITTKVAPCDVTTVTAIAIAHSIARARRSCNINGGSGAWRAFPACLVCKWCPHCQLPFSHIRTQCVDPRVLPGERCYGDGVSLPTVYFLTAMTENDVDRPYSVSPKKAASSGMWK